MANQIAGRRTKTIFSHLLSSMNLADIGLIGLAVMGENLILNIASKGFRVACYNRTVSKVTEFTTGRGNHPNIVGCLSVQDLVNHLKKPRMIMLMVRAGAPVDEAIRGLLPFLERGDTIIDGGNSNFLDTNRRMKELQVKGILYMGVGVSGGEEGALNGPSLMPGGPIEAWHHIKPIFQTIAAQVEGSPCCDYVGDAGAGHFVKTVHNGIEYGDMELIAEAYHLMRDYVGLSNTEISEVFQKWNSGELRSYLIEITAEIFLKKDPETGLHVVDLILDSAGQKGTGKWTVITGLELGSPVTLIAEAVFARALSSRKEHRVQAHKILRGPEFSPPSVKDRAAYLNDLRDAVYASKLVSYAQGFSLMNEAAKEYHWRLNYAAIALMWRGGCIIRSDFLGKIAESFSQNPSLENLILSDFFAGKLSQKQTGWRKVVSTASLTGFSVPSLSSALSYFDGMRTEKMPANLIQAQRDYFGAHTYERVDKKPGNFYHTNWTGHGGSTSSSSYQA